MCVDMEVIRGLSLVHIGVFLWSLVPQVILDVVSGLAFVTLGCNFILIKNDFVHVPFRCGLVRHLLLSVSRPCAGRLSGIAIYPHLKSLYLGSECRGLWRRG